MADLELRDAGLGTRQWGPWTASGSPDPGFAEAERQIHYALLTDPELLTYFRRRFREHGDVDYDAMVRLLGYVWDCPHGERARPSLWPLRTHARGGARLMGSLGGSTRLQRASWAVRRRAARLTTADVDEPAHTPAIARDHERPRLSPCDSMMSGSRAQRSRSLILDRPRPRRVR
jgi:hypothetical protein